MTRRLQEALCTERPTRLCHSSLALLTTANAAPLQSVHHLSPLQEQSVPFTNHQVPLASQIFTHLKTLSELLHGRLLSHPQVTQVGPHVAPRAAGAPQPPGMCGPEPGAPQSSQCSLFLWRAQPASLCCTQANSSHRSCRD